MSEIKISTLIDRVIAIAKQNNDSKLLHWAYLEALGYHYSNKHMTDDDVVPEYREIPIEHRDQYNRPIIITDPEIKEINNTRVRHSVSELEDYSKKNGLLSAKEPIIINLIRKHFNVPVTHYIFTPSSLKAVLHLIKQETIERIEKYVNSDEIMSESFKSSKILNNESVVNSVFISYRFNNEDKELVKGLIDLLKSAGFDVITGLKNPIGSISKSIINKIKKAEKFVVIMTKRDKKENGKYTTSSWLLEEKGIAIAYDKPCIILVEDEIDDNDIGGMQGDDQRLHFTRNNFTSKVADAIKMLKGEVQ